MKIKGLVCGLVAAGLCGAANAEMSQFYAGSGAGIYYVDLDGVDFDETAPTLRLFGGYQLNDYVSFEAGYTNLFESSADFGGTDVNLEGSSWDLTVRPSLPIADNFTAFAVLGWSSYEFDLSADAGGGVTVSDSESENDLLYGLGAAMNLNDSWNVRGEWTTVDVDDADFGMFSLSAVYNFR